MSGSEDQGDKTWTVDKAIKEMFCEQSGKAASEISEATTPEDLDFDSLDCIEVVMAMEEEFDIQIPDEDAERWKTVGDAIHYVEEVLS